MTLLRSSDQNSREINVALLSLEADIKNKIANFDTSVIDKQLVEINNRIDKINAGGNNTSAQINDIRYEIEDINSKLKGNSAKIENIEQKLADIFSAENKVTDFNTTTDAGIYFWVDDAANKPGNYGVLLVNKYDSGSGSLWINQIAYGTNSKIYFRQNINSGNWTEWKAVAFTTDIENTTTKTLDLNTVSTGTTKYIKLGTFRWKDSISLRCRLYGNGFEDVVNINILNGNTNSVSVCGYYSTNSRLTQAIIVKRGDAWNSNIEIYLQVMQLATLSIDVTIEKDFQDRINISESTTAPSGKLEEIAFNSINGMFSNNIDAKFLTLRNGNIENLNTFGNEPLSIGTPSSINLGIDRNSIQARNNGAADALYLNYYGGDVKIGAGNVNGSKLTIQGKTVSSNSYTDTNPKLEFKNEDASQNISLTFNDYDAVQDPASLTLNGNQGNEYFIAPNIKATGNFYGNLSGKADTADSLSYQHGNEINFKGGAQGQCWFNYRNADTEGPSPVDTMEYIFCNYSSDTSKSVIKAGSFNGTTAKASSKMVIPIGAPSSLEDGCIWIER